MEYQSETFCTFIFILLSIIWYQIKNRNEREVNMTWIIEKIEEKEIQIRNLSEENDDLRKLNSEQSEGISELYDCYKKLKDIEESHVHQIQELSSVKSEILELKKQFELMRKSQLAETSELRRIIKILSDERGVLRKNSTSDSSPNQNSVIDQNSEQKNISVKESTRKNTSRFAQVGARHPLSNNLKPLYYGDRTLSGPGCRLHNVILLGVEMR